MTLRIVEIHRVLKPTGSFYLHCDPTASHYLKLVLDAVFCGQGGDYKSEVIWKRTASHSAAKRWGNIHDVILFYTKGSEFVWNPVLLSHSEGYSGRYKNTDDKGRVWADDNLSAPGLRGGFSGKPWRGFDVGLKGNHWKVSSKAVEAIVGDRAKTMNTLEKLDVLDADGLIHWPKGGGFPRFKRVLSEGATVPDIISDIPPLNSQAAERLGYPTQKPEALLERIIKASSNEGDTVLDAYCGCGTTVAVAQRLGRKWIGIDVTYQSIALILKRFQDTYEKNGTWPEVEANIHLDGVPRDLESAMALANRKDDKTRKEFEKWAVLTFSRNQARINEKKGADGGIDGIAYFLLDKDSNGKAIFQVKSRPGNRGDLATLNSDRQREKAEFGFLICTALPTKPMRDEIAAAGKYKHPLLDREDDRLQVVTVAELFAPHNHRLDLPMARMDAVKAAAAAGDADKQETLF